MEFNIVGAYTAYADQKTDNEAVDLYRFYSSVFSRFSEIGHIGYPARHIGYECRIDENKVLVLPGFEVTEPYSIPKGFSRLAIDKENIHLTKCEDSGVLLEQDRPGGWIWADTVTIHGREWILGDFSVDLSLFWDLGFTGIREFWMNFNIFGNEEIENGDRIALVEYRGTWPDEFRVFKEWMLTHFPQDLFGRIEHIGSTAIPGMPAKPVVDLLVEIPSFGEARKRVLPLLSDESWEYCWYNGHMVLIKRDKYRGVRTHHLHLVPKGHEQWRCMAFRDYLRTDNNRAAEYIALKRKLSVAFPDDREGYTRAKSEFVRAVTEEALREGY